MIGSPEAAPAAASGVRKLAPWHRSALGGVLVVAAGCVLLLLAADRILRGIAAVVRPVEAMYGEAIIYDQAARLVHGEALYQSLDRMPLTVT